MLRSRYLRQPATTFVGGSVATGVSSICNAKEYNLGKYKELMDKLGDASLDIESVLDEFPTGSHHHQQNRYNATRRTRDTLNEEEQLRTIEILLLRYQDERVRLDDVLSDGEEGGDDAVEVRDDGRRSTETVAPFGLLSQTSTHYQFNSPAPAGLDMGPNARTVEGGPEEQAWGFGLGVYIQNHVLFQPLAQSPSTSENQPQNYQNGPEDEPHSGLTPPLDRRSSHRASGQDSPSR